MTYEHKFTITISPAFKQLIKAVENSPQDSPERDRAKQALGQFVYRLWDDWVNEDDEDEGDLDAAQERMQHFQDEIDSYADDDDD